MKFKIIYNLDKMTIDANSKAEAIRKAIKILNIPKSGVKLISCQPIRD